MLCVTFIFIYKKIRLKKKLISIKSQNISQNPSNIYKNIYRFSTNERTQNLNSSRNGKRAKSQPSKPTLTCMVHVIALRQMPGLTYLLGTSIQILISF